MVAETARSIRKIPFRVLSSVIASANCGRGESPHMGHTNVIKEAKSTR